MAWTGLHNVIEVTGAKCTDLAVADVLMTDSVVEAHHPRACGIFLFVPQVLFSPRVWCILPLKGLF